MPASRPRVLVISDRPQLRQETGGLLNGCGDVTTAANSADGLVALDAPDVIVLDAALPEVADLRLLRELRGDPRVADAGIIVLAQERRDEDCVAMLEAGADDCLPVSVGAPELVARIQAYAARAARRRSARASPNATEQSRDPYRSVFSAMQEGLLLAELVESAEGGLTDFRYLDMNPTAERLMAVPRERFIGRTAREINPSVEEGILQLCAEVVRTGEPQRRDIYRPALGQYHQTVFFRPAVGQLAVLFWDVTERRKTDAELARVADSLTRERERLAVALRIGQMGIYEWRLGEPTVWWSPEVYPLYGVDPRTFTPTVESFSALIHPDDREALWRRTQDAIARREVFMHEYRIVRPDGEVRWLANRSHVGLDASGAVDRITGVAVDITERRQADQRLAVLLSSIDDHLVSYDRQWRYVFVNAAAARILGKTREELIGKSIWELFPGAVGNQYYRNVHTALEEQRVIHDEHYYEPFDRWFENHVYPSEDGVTVFSTDITARKKAEAALHERDEALREADRRKDEFLAMLAHELRNPLAAIRNAVQILVHTEGHGDAARMASGILDRQVRHMVRHVDDLLDVSRISRGRVELRKERTDLVHVVNVALEATRPPAGQRSPALTVALPEEPVYVHGDPVRLAQAVGNLLNNAFKFTQDGGQVWLALAREGREAVIRVRDEGIGIEAAHLERIFEMFAQVDTSLERTRGGLGLGLTLVKNLVELHDGSVEAHSAGPGRGSEFVVRLPVV